MNEKIVVEKVERELQERCDLVRREFSFSGGRVDLMAFDWSGHDPYYVESLAVECKGEIEYAKKVYSLLIEQLTRYLKVLPRLYLAFPKPKRDRILDDIKTLCRLNDVGSVAVASKLEWEPPLQIKDEKHRWTAMLDGSKHFVDVRTRGAMFLTFQDVFGKNSLWGPTWCSTPERADQVQYTAFQEQQQCRLAVNLEDSRKIMGQVDMERLSRVLRQETREAEFRVYYEKYHGPGRRTRIVLLRKLAGAISLDDLQYIRQKSAQGAMLHLSIGVPIWTSEALNRDEHRKRMEGARETLRPIREALSKRQP